MELRIESAFGIAQEGILETLLGVELGVELRAVLGAAQNGKAFRRELFSEFVESVALCGSAAGAGLHLHTGHDTNKSFLRFIS